MKGSDSSQRNRQGARASEWKAKRDRAPRHSLAAQRQTRWHDAKAWRNSAGKDANCWQHGGIPGRSGGGRRPSRRHGGKAYGVAARQHSLVTIADTGGMAAPTGGTSKG
eukprot:gene15276-biopygen3225